MSFNNTLLGICRFSLLRRRRLTAFICLAVMGLASFAFASDDEPIPVEDSRQQIKRAEKLSRRGEFVEAEKILRSVMQTSPGNPKVSLSLARLLLRQKRIPEAYNLAFEVAKSNPRNSYAFAIVGDALLSIGEFENAKLAYLNSIYLNKKEAMAWAGLGMLDFYENRISDSLENLREAVYYEPNEPDFAFALGQVSARAEMYKEAAEAYETFLRIGMKTNDERRERIAGLIRFLRFLGNKESLFSLSGEKKTSVPIEIVGNRPIITLRVNDREELLRFVLDTGSGISVISDVTAKRLKIKSITKGGKARALGGDGKFEIVYGFLKNVKIGGVKIRNVPIYIREFHGSGAQVDGYIGISLISKFLTTVDYGNLLFSIVRKDSVEDRKTENDVDTGASISVISDDLANSKEITPYIDSEKMRVIGAAGITENVPSFMLPRVTFGTHSQNQIRAVALDLDVINEASGFYQAGILGGNFLKDYSLTFDFENSKVIFVPIRK
jgi:tetratricopeptide (TPR) repeat protein